jgi:hypothetical protein
MDPFNLKSPYLNLPELPAITPMSHWLSGEAAFIALKKAVDELANSAPEDHDVLVQAFNLSVNQIRYVDPHTLIFTGFDANGNAASAVCHYSQLVAHVVYLPKRGKDRVVTGFAQEGAP